MNITTEIDPNVIARSTPVADIRIDRTSATDLKPQPLRSARPASAHTEPTKKIAPKLAPFWALSGQVLGTEAGAYHGAETTIFLGMMLACGLQVCVTVYQLGTMFSSLPMTAIGQSLTFVRF
jgi:hypothetical protein